MAKVSIPPNSSFSCMCLDVQKHLKSFGICIDANSWIETFVPRFPHHLRIAQLTKSDLFRWLLSGWTCACLHAIWLTDFVIHIRRTLSQRLHCEAGRRKMPSGWKPRLLNKPSVPPFPEILPALTQTFWPFFITTPTNMTEALQRYIKTPQGSVKGAIEEER